MSRETDLSNLEIRNIPDPWHNAGRKWSVIDGTTVKTDRTVEADVAIIGSGAGGGVSAEILAQAGLRVVLIEAGRLKSSDAFDMHEGEAYRDLYQEGGGMVTKDGNIAILQGRAVGGSTTVNWTSSFRTPKETLQHWHDRYGVQGMDREAMNPWFDRMTKRLNIHKWLVPPNDNNDKLKLGCEKLGWAWDLIPRNVKQCWNIGYCGMGCPTNAKQSMLVTTIPSALKSGATLVHSCRAEKLLIKGDKVTAVTCLPLDEHHMPTGASLTVRAKTVVAAGGGIHTPGLLKRSKVPDPNDRVGKRTFLHVTNFVAGLYPEVVAGYYGAPQSTYSDEFVWKQGVEGPLGYKLEMMPTDPAVMAALLGGYGKENRRHITNLPHYSEAIALMRDGFHEQSPGGTVELRDDGSPVLDYPVNDYLFDGIRRAFLTMAEMHFAAGAKQVRPHHSDTRDCNSWKEAESLIKGLRYESGFVPLGSAHVMGGCAMGTDRDHCVTDSDGRYHYLDNLYVFDGSTFPTSLGVNPQLTIYSIAARNASALAKKLASA